MRYVVVNVEQCQNEHTLGKKEYDSYCKKIHLIKRDCLSFEVWQSDMNITYAHIACWRENAKYDEDLVVNCDSLCKYYSNELIKFLKNEHSSNSLLSRDDRYSYFIRKDYLRRLLSVVDKNGLVLPLYEFIELLGILEVNTTNRLHLLLTDGLGNRMFQIASCYALCKEHNLSLSLIVCSNKHTTNTYKFIMNKFDKTSQEQALELLNDKNVCIKERPDHIFDYDGDLVERLKKQQVALVQGYFQSSLYFRDYIDDVRNIFKCPELIEKHILTKFSDIENCWFIHIRLKDYVESESQRNKHYIDLSEYYQTSLSSINVSQQKVLLFSDDSLENVQAFYPFIRKYTSIQFMDERDEVLAFYMMSFCKKGGICANSTFSWWAAEMNDNPNKLVFRPPKMVNNYTGKFRM